MKRLLFVWVCVFAMHFSYGQYLLVEDFDFTGMVAGTDGWISSSGVSNFMQTLIPGLVFPNYPGSGIGNAVAVNGVSGEDVYKKIPDRTQLYYSFLIKVVASNTTKKTDYVSALGKEQSSGVNGTLNGNYFARIILQTLGDGTWKIGTSNWGVTNTTNPPVYSSHVFNNNQTYAVVVSFDMSSNYKVQIWVLESSFMFDKSNAGPPDVVFTAAPATAALPKSIDAVTLRQSSSAPSVVMDALRVFEYWDAQVLPLKILSFNGVVDRSGYAKLEWRVAQAVNVKHFVVERSLNAREFVPRSIMECINQPQEKTYTCIDYNTDVGQVYFRLKTVDMDGKETYSDIIRLIIPSNRKIKIGVLGGKTVRVLLPLDFPNATLKILDLNGQVRKVFSVSGTDASKLLTLTGLTEGIYILKVENQQSTFSEKFFLQ